MAADFFLKLDGIDGESAGAILEEYGSILSPDAATLIRVATTIDGVDSFDFKYFEVSSGPPEGNEADGHTKEIDVLSWSWGTTQGSTFHNMTAEEIEELILVETDLNVDVMLQDRGGSDEVYLKIALKDVLITSYSDSGGDDDLRDLGDFDLLL